VWADRPFWQVRPLRDIALFLLTVIVAAGLIWLGNYLQSIFTPVLIALALAYVFNPVITWAEWRANMPRALTVSLILTVLLVVAVGFVVWLAPIISAEITGVVNTIRQFVQDPPPWAGDAAESAGIDIDNVWAEAAQRIENVRSNVTEVAAMALAGSGEAIGAIGSVVGTTVYIAATAVLIPVYFFFFAWRFPSIRSIEPYVPSVHRDEVFGLLKRMDETVSSYFRGRLLIGLIMGVMFAVGWWLVGVPYAVLLGLFTGLLSLIPYAAGLGWPIAMLLAYMTHVPGGAEAAAEAAGAVAAGGAGGDGEAAAFPWWQVVLGPTLVYFVVQNVEGWLLTPYIQGKSTGLGPVTVIIVVFMGGALGGLYGMILAIPIAACVKILLKDALAPRMKRWASGYE